MSSTNPIDDERAAPKGNPSPSENTDKTNSQIKPLASGATDVTCHIKRDWLDYASAGLESIGLIGLIVYAFFTYGILCASKKSAQAAKDAAKAAQDAANITAQQLVLDTRPWINLNPGNSIEAEGKIGVDFTMSNPGKTAANEVRWEVSTAFVRFDQSSGSFGFVEPKFEKLVNWDKSMYPAGSNNGGTLYGNHIPSDSQMERWRVHEVAQQFAIRVTYRDSVDVTHPLRTTQLCFYVLRGNASNIQCPLGYNFQN